MTTSLEYLSLLQIKVFWKKDLCLHISSFWDLKGKSDEGRLTGAFLSMGLMTNFLSLKEMFRISLQGKPIFGVSLGGKCWYLVIDAHRQFSILKMKLYLWGVEYFAIKAASRWRWYARDLQINPSQLLYIIVICDQISVLPIQVSTQEMGTELLCTSWCAVSVGKEREWVWVAGQETISKPCPTHEWEEDRKSNRPHPSLLYC